MSRPDKENASDRFEKTARELRKHWPRPSEALVSRVEALSERQAEQGPRRARPQLSRRRLVFALAAVLTVAVAGAVVTGELKQSPRSAATATTPGTQLKMLGLPAEGNTSGANPNATDQSAGSSVMRKSASESSTTATQMFAHVKAGGSVAPITTGNRLAELRAILLLQVENRDQLSQRTADAMKIARSFNGYVVAARVHAPSHGVATSYLELKVPAKRSQEALIRISALGKILSQQVSLEDVKATVTEEGNAIQALKREIASLEQTLKSQSLTAKARSQLQIQLANDRARLNSLRVQRTRDILRGRLATITLTFTTGDLPKAAATPSRVHKAIDRAWDGLSSEISWAAMAVIVASPFLVLALVLALGLRSRRRREERRLLEK